MKVSVAGGKLEVEPELIACVEEIAQGLEPAHFWEALAGIIEKFGARNEALLAKRDAIQEQLDVWYMQRAGVPLEMAEYTEFLREIGYIVPAGDPFSVSTTCVDPEISTIAGPQLVCPVDNARFAINAANARWGSLLDALYGTDVVPGDRGGPYSAERGALVFEKAEAFLDNAFTLERPRFSVSRAHYADVQSYGIMEKNGVYKLVPQNLRTLH
jgi:malate synthase